MKIKWRGVSNPNLWFHHPRAFWGSIYYKLPLRRNWYLAAHDPIYVGLWIGLTVIMLSVVVVFLVL